MTTLHLTKLKNFSLLAALLFQCYSLTPMPGEVWNPYEFWKPSIDSRRSDITAQQTEASSYLTRAQLAVAAGAALLGTATAAYSRYRYKTLKKNYDDIYARYKDIIELFEQPQARGLSSVLVQTVEPTDALEESRDDAHLVAVVLSGNNQKKFNSYVSEKYQSLDAFEKSLTTDKQTLTQDTTWIPILRDNITTLTNKLKHLLLYTQEMKKNNHDINIAPALPSSSRPHTTKSVPERKQVPSRQAPICGEGSVPIVLSRATMDRSNANKQIQFEKEAISQTIQAGQPGQPHAIAGIIAKLPERFIEFMQEQKGFDTFIQYIKRNPNNLPVIRSTIKTSSLDQKLRTAIVNELNDAFLQAILPDENVLLIFIRHEPEVFTNILIRRPDYLIDYMNSYPEYFNSIIQKISADEQLPQEVVNRLRKIMNQNAPPVYHEPQKSFEEQGSTQPQRPFVPAVKLAEMYAGLKPGDETLFKKLIDNSANSRTLAEFIQQNPQRLIEFVQKNPQYLIKVVQKASYAIPQDWRTYAAEQFQTIVKAAPRDQISAEDKAIAMQAIEKNLLSARPAMPYEPEQFVPQFVQQPAPQPAVQEILPSSQSPRSNVGYSKFETMGWE